MGFIRLAPAAALLPLLASGRPTTACSDLDHHTLHMEPSFGRRCSAPFPEVDLLALEWFTK